MFCTKNQALKNIISFWSLKLLGNYRSTPDIYSFPLIRYSFLRVHQSCGRFLKTLGHVTRINKVIKQRWHIKMRQRLPPNGAQIRPARKTAAVAVKMRTMPVKWRLEFIMHTPCSAYL